MIKDFELMGNKLELVDDSSHHIQIHASSSSTLTGQQQQQQQPIAAAPSISRVVAGTGRSCASGTTSESTSSVASSASERRQSLASSSRDNSSSIDSSATIATTITNQRTSPTNLVLSKAEQQQKADQTIKLEALSSGTLKSNEGRQSSSNNRRPLGESLVANSDEQEHFERLILMDIEGKFSQLSLSLYGLAQCCSDEYKTLPYFTLPFSFARLLARLCPPRLRAFLDHAPCDSTLNFRFERFHSLLPFVRC